MSEVTPEAVDAFISKWSAISASELATSQPFLLALCELLQVEAPVHSERYMFERPITFKHGDGTTSPGRIDLYNQGAFVLESKKLRASDGTKRFDDGMLRARSQAEGYARALPPLPRWFYGLATCSGTSGPGATSIHPFR